MTKKGLDLGSMIDAPPLPLDLDTPQAGARPFTAKRRVERRTDQMSIRMKPSTRDRIEALAEAEGVPIAEIIERAIAAYGKPK